MMKGELKSEKKAQRQQHGPQWHQPRPEELGGSAVGGGGGDPVWEGRPADSLGALLPPPPPGSIGHRGGTTC